MNSRTFFRAFIIAATMASAGIASAYELKHLSDPSLDDFMVTVSAHRDSGLSALQNRIEHIETTEGLYAPSLYGYLVELSRVRQENNQHLEAIDVFQRIQNLTHSLDGVHTPLQLESVRLQSRSRAALGQFVKADKLEKFHLWVAERNYEGLDLVPSLWRMADWQRTTLQYRASIRHYDRTLSLLESHEPAKVLTVRTLEARALAEHLAKFCCANESLGLALENRLNNDFSDQVANEVAMLNLADMHTLYNKQKDEAAILYAKLGSAPVALLGPRSQTDYIQALDNANNPLHKNARVEVHYPKKTQTVTFGEKKIRPPTASIGEPVRLCADNVTRDGYVDVSMDVSAEGKPQNVMITGNVPIQTKRYLREVLLESRYRPEIKNGVAVTQPLEFRQYFDRTRPLRTDKVSGWRNILAEHACQIVAMR